MSPITDINPSELPALRSQIQEFIEELRGDIQVCEYLGRGDSSTTETLRRSLIQAHRDIDLIDATLSYHRARESYDKATDPASKRAAGEQMQFWSGKMSTFENSKGWAS